MIGVHHAVVLVNSKRRAQFVYVPQQYVSHTRQSFARRAQRLAAPELARELET